MFLSVFVVLFWEYYRFVIRQKLSYPLPKSAPSTQRLQVSRLSFGHLFSATLEAQLRVDP